MKIKPIHIILSAACLIVVIAAPFLNFEDSTLSYGRPEPCGIISVMQADVFEGGSGSRTEWLKKRAVEFEAKNPGVYVEVTSASAGQILAAAESGTLPDMVSFSPGLGAAVYPHLAPYTGAVSAREDVAEGGRAGSGYYAVPWCMGGYALVGYSDYLQKAGVGEGEPLLPHAFSSSVTVKREKNDVTLPSLTYGAAAYNSPLSALSLHGDEIRGGAFTPATSFAQYGAYDAFTGGYSSTLLLGTQRDLVRLSAKLEAGKIKPLRMQPLSGFTDLVQYLGINKACADNKYRYAVRFIEFLLSEAVQQKLAALGMFNVLGERYYGETWMGELEAALAGGVKTVNAFLPQAGIEKLRQDAAAALQR